MAIAHITRLEDFGTRSLVTHGLMVISFVGAVLTGLSVGGDLGVVSFVALLNLTAGLWIAQSIHSLGHTQAGGEYSGVLNELLDTDRHTGEGFDAGRFGRLLTLISAVTAVTLLTSAQVLGGALFAVGVVAVGTIALVTAIIGFLIAAGASYDATQERKLAEFEARRDSTDQSDVRPASDR